MFSISKFGAVAASVALVAIATNPSPADYQQYLYRKTCQQQPISNWDTWVICKTWETMPGVARQLVSSQYITRKNYWLFSIYVTNAPVVYDESFGFGLRFIETRALAKLDFFQDTIAFDNMDELRPVSIETLGRSEGSGTGLFIG